MTDRSRETIARLSTPHLADACLRVGVPVRCAPAGLRSIATGMRCYGRALPVRHVGSVDIFFEAIERASPGDVLIVDNGGRLDEGCVGDLVTLEVKNAGLAGIVIWGVHRDTSELLEIGLPFFSLGTMPTGPQRLDPRSPDSFDWAHLGSWVVTGKDFISCDDDGVLVLSESSLPVVSDTAATIRETERRHADQMKAGISFRKQTRFSEYLATRETNPSYGFREHLKNAGNAIET